jgi:hypothetical protein
LDEEIKENNMGRATVMPERDEKYIQIVDRNI